MTKSLGKFLKINSSRVYLARFASQAAAAAPAGGWVLDAGAGDCPYRPYFEHVHYETADFCQVDKSYGAITYVCDLASLPVEAGRYDLVFCSQTLEHVPDPRQVLKELYRVLKPGGQLWLSAPLFFAEHEVPYDYYRYTRYGFTHLFEATGFTIGSLEWLEGYYGTLAYQLRLASTDLPTRGSDYGGGLLGWLLGVLAWPLKLLFAGLSLVFTQLDLRHRYVSGGLCKNYAVVAHKPEAAEHADQASPL